MTNPWLSWLNCVVIGVISLLVLGMGIIWIKRPKEITCGNPVSKQCGLPKGAFEMPSEAYGKIGEPLLVLLNAPPSLQLPDLRQQLLYYGKNGRPDAQSSHILLHFSFNGSKTIVSIPPGDRLYLVYDKKNPPSRYNFSPNNQETSLWIEGTVADSEVHVKVCMKNENGQLITEPESLAQFNLPEKEFIRYAGTAWELGTWRVDGTLLARQRARWYGPDRFLERHGGEEYKDMAGKHRIDFGENDDVYSIFLNVGDSVIWNENRWQQVQPGEESLKYPLMVVKKIDERLMTLELWDVEGKGKILLNVLKSVEPWVVQNAQTLQHMFKFVGARTRSQCVFEINHERMLISPSDWLLLTQKGWKKLCTEEEIDNYVNRKTTGTLFVFDGLSRKDEHQVLLGTLYNATRSDFQEVEIPMQGAKASQAKEAPNESKDLDDDEDIKTPSTPSKAGNPVPTFPPQVPPLQHPAKDQPYTR